MRDFLHMNSDQVLDGLFFGFGVLAVYLGAVFTGALVRSLGGAGSKGITVAGRYLSGWFYYLRGDDRDIVNVTLNMIADGRLTFDTLVADRKIWFVWPNAYRVALIRRAAKRTTPDNPVLSFPEAPRRPRSFTGRIGHWFGERLHDLLASGKIVENGRTQRVRLIREDDYKATFGPVISLVSEKCSNEHAIDLALGYPMDEHRFVIALTFEKLHNRRARHLRAMVMWEQTLLALPDTCPDVDMEEHKTRFCTLQAIARQYRAHPERFGIVKIWRPKITVSPAGIRAAFGIAPGMAVE